MKVCASRPAARACIGIVVIFWGGAAHGSPNLLQNPHFDVDHASWVTYSTGDILVPDSSSCTASHALSSLSAGDPVLDQQDVWISQCVTLGAPPPPTLHSRMSHSPSGSFDRAITRLSYFEDSFCSNFSIISETEGDLADGAGTWTSSTFTSAVPAKAGSVRLWLVFEKLSPFPFTARVDSVVLLDEDFVFADDFEIGETCRWSAVAP